MSKLTHILKSTTALVLATFVFLDGAGLILAGLWALGSPASSYRLPTALVSAALGVLMAGYFIPWFTRSDDRFLAALFGLLLGFGSGLYLFGTYILLAPWTFAGIFLAVAGSALPQPRGRIPAQAPDPRTPSLQGERILESSLYAGDLGAARDFYGGVLGLPTLREDSLMLAFRCQGSVLLIFDPEKSLKEDRDVPSHGSRGPGHLAFQVPERELKAWRSHLEAHGVEIESEMGWPGGGRSLYFRDPAGNSLELASPTLWSGIPARKQVD